MARKRRRYSREGRYLFVDGYNILHQWTGLSQLMQEDLEQAREKLIEKMIEYAHITGWSVILVFDAYKVKGNEGSIEKKNGIEIVYTKELETADHYIEKELTHIGRVKDVAVATSDHIEQQLILARGGRRISARELEIEVENTENHIRLEAKRIKKVQRLKNGLGEDILEDLRKIKNQLKEKEK